MAGSITEVESHDEVRGERSVTLECNECTEQRYNWGHGSVTSEHRKCNRGMASKFTRMYGISVGMGM